MKNMILFSGLITSSVIFCASHESAVSVASLIKRFNAMSQTEEKDTGLVAEEVQTSTKNAHQKVTGSIPCTRNHPPKKNPTLNITIGQVSIKDQMQGKYAEEGVVEVFTKSCQLGHWACVEKERWQCMNGILHVSRRPHEKITDIRIIVSGYARPFGIRIFKIR